MACAAAEGHEWVNGPEATLTSVGKGELALILNSSPQLTSGMDEGGENSSSLWLAGH